MFGPAIILTLLSWLLLCLALPLMILLRLPVATLQIYASGLLILTPLVAGFLCFRTALVFDTGDAMRRVWTLLGLGLLSWGIGQILYALFLALNQGQEPPYPWLSDAGYLLMAVLIIVALVIFRRSMQIPVPLWGKLVGGLVFLGTLGLATLSSLQNLKDATTLLQLLVDVGYILLDPALLGVTVVSASLLAGGIAAMPWWFGLAGLFLYYLGNVVYNYQVARDLYVTGSLVDVSWPLAFGLIALAAMLTQRMFKQ